ncbi:MAG: M48 family metalloprotease, partial [Elusimicrobia bacterium]|nr:M48 family metalloprotease [Elusimicrobiota bacterium]
YRAAIADVIPGIPEDATTDQVRQALDAAYAAPDRDKTFWALGVNVLEGVLSHEINHITHRDMIVSGSGAAVSSAIVATSKSVFWDRIGVRKLAQAVKSFARDLWTWIKATWKRVKDRVAGKSSNSIEAAPGVLGLDPFSPGQGLILTWAEPVSTVLQMTVSRERESLADQGGSQLSGHPERLGLALGLLSSWRPSAAQDVESGQFRNLTALSGIMTVNPIQQLYDAGLLREFRAAARSLRGAEPEDRIFATWFETHPEIRRRIEALHDLLPEKSAAPSAGPAAPGGPLAPTSAAGSGSRQIGRLYPSSPAGVWEPMGRGFNSLGANSYPYLAKVHLKIALHPPDTPPGQKTGPPAQEESPRGSFQKIWDKVTKPFRVFSDKNRNRPFRQIMVAEGMMVLAASFNGVGIRGLVGSDARMSISSGVFQLGQLLSNVFIGPLMERKPHLNKTLGHLYVAMGLAVLAIAAGYFWGHPIFGFFAAAWFLVGALRGTAWVGEATLYSKIVQSSRAYTKASAIYSAMINFVGFFAYLAAGWFLGFANERFTKQGLGNPLTFAIAGALMLLAVPLFRTLSVTEDPAEAAVRREFSEKLLPVLGSRLRKTYFDWESTPEGAEQILVAEVRTPKAAGSRLAGAGTRDMIAISEEFAGYRVKVVEPRKPLREIADGARITWRDPFLRLLMLLTVSAFAVGAAMYPAISTYIHSVLHLEAANQMVPGFLRAIPLLGGLIHYLVSGSDGALGLYFAVASLAIGLTSLPFVLLGDRPNSDFEEVLGKFSDELEKHDALSVDNGRAVGAARKARDEVLLDYVDLWRKDPGANRTLAQFQQDLLESARARLGALTTPEEAQRAIEATGLGAALNVWAEKHHRRVLATARRDARSGMSSKARQARWSAVLFALGFLCYFGVFRASGIWTSLGWLLLASILQSPAWIVLFEGSLNNEIIAEKYSDYRTRLYAFVGVYALAAGVLGAFGFWFLTWLFNPQPPQSLGEQILRYVLTGVDTYLPGVGAAALSVRAFLATLGTSWILWTMIGFQALVAALFIWAAAFKIPAIGRDLLKNALRHRGE